MAETIEVGRAGSTAGVHTITGLTPDEVRLLQDIVTEEAEALEDLRRGNVGGECGRLALIDAIHPKLEVL